MINKTDIFVKDLDIIMEIRKLRKFAMSLPITERYTVFIQILDLEKERKRLKLLREIRNELKGLKIIQEINSELKEIKENLNMEFDSNQLRHDLITELKETFKKPKLITNYPSKVKPILNNQQVKNAMLFSELRIKHYNLDVRYNG